MTLGKKRLSTTAVYDEIITFFLNLSNEIELYS